MKIIQGALNILLIVHTIFGFVDGQITVKKLSKEQNEQRLKNCGKEPGPNSPLLKERSHSWWIGHMKNNQNTEPASKYGLVLISPYHALISSTILLDPIFKMSGCQNNKLSSIILYGFRSVYFWLDKNELGHFLPTVVKSWTFYGDCSDRKGSIVIVEFDKEVSSPYACFPDQQFYDTQIGAKAILSYRETGRYYPSYDQQEGTFGSCNSKTAQLCWGNFSETPIAFFRTLTGSMPIIATASTPTAIGFAHDYSSKTFQLTDFRKFIDPICDLIGVCPRPPTTTKSTTKTTTKVGMTNPKTTITEIETTTKTTTTTQTTTTTTQTTTTTTTRRYIPALIADPETMDFEVEYYIPKKRMRKNGNEKNYFWLTVIFLVLGLVE